MKQYESFRERFLESNDRFQQALLEAIRAHHTGVLLFDDLLTAVEKREGELQETVDEIKRLTLEQGEQIRALRARLNGG